MSIKFIIVLGFLLVSAFAEEQNVEPAKSSHPGEILEQEKEAIAEAKAEVNFGDLKKDGKNLNKEVVEKIENVDNGVKASAKASASFNFNFEKLIAKLFEAFQQNKENDKVENNDEGKSAENEINEEIENKKEEDNEEAEDNKQSEENPVEDDKSPFICSYNVHARASASASSSSSSSSSFNFNFYDPKEEKEGDENENEEIQDENTDAPQDNDSVVDDLQENFEENEQPIDVENVEVPEHCNQQKSEDKEPVIEEPLKPEEETQVEEVEQ